MLAAPARVAPCAWLCASRNKSQGRICQKINNIIRLALDTMQRSTDVVIPSMPEVSAIAAILIHVAHRVTIDERGHSRNEDHHDRTQSVDVEADGKGKIGNCGRIVQLDGDGALGGHESEGDESSHKGSHDGKQPGPSRSGLDRRV